MARTRPRRRHLLKRRCPLANMIFTADLEDISTAFSNKESLSQVSANFWTGFIGPSTRSRPRRGTGRARRQCSDAYLSAARGTRRCQAMPTCGTGKLNSSREISSPSSLHNIRNAFLPVPLAADL